MLLFLCLCVPVLTGNYWSPRRWLFWHRCRQVIMWLLQLTDADYIETSVESVLHVNMSTSCKVDIASRSWNITIHGNLTTIPYGIARCNLPSGSGDLLQPKLGLNLVTPAGSKAELTWVVVTSQDSLPAKDGRLSQKWKPGSVMTGIQTCGLPGCEFGILTTRSPSHLLMLDGTCVCVCVNNWHIVLSYGAHTHTPTWFYS